MKVRLIRVALLLLLGALVATGIRQSLVSSQAGRHAVPQAVAGGIPTQTDQQIESFLSRVARNAGDVESLTLLATAYIRKVRESGDVSYAERAQRAVEEALRVAPRDPMAIKTLAWAHLIKHEFGTAGRLATEALRGDPNDHQLYGILVDALVEQGEYRAAVEAAQHMLDLRPGAAAYTRASYLRELHGDPEGALTMMQMALEATSRRDREAFAWTLVQVGNLQLARGDQAGAGRQYDLALRILPNYYYALAGLAAGRAAQGRLAEAAALYTRALAIIPMPEVAAALGDVYTRMGRRREAARQYDLVEYVGTLNRLNRGVFNRELAFFYADHDRRLDEAVVLAERERQVRPDIYTYDTLAWAYYKVARLADADRAMQRALTLGTRDARLFYHAGMIALGRGDRPKARQYLTRALQINPQFHVLHAPTARRTLADMEGGRTP